MATLTQIVQDIYAAFGRGDIDAIVAAFADDIRFVHSGGPVVPYAKDRRGKTQATAFFADLAECVEVTRFEVDRCIEQGSSVVALGRWSGRTKRNGRTFESEWAMVWDFAGGKVQHYRAYENTLAVGDAFRA